MAKVNRLKYFKGWESMFGSTEFEYGARADVKAKVKSFRYNETSCYCKILSGSNSYAASINYAPTDGQGWRDIPVYCTCSRATKSREGKTGKNKWYNDYDSMFDERPKPYEWYRCSHMSVMFHMWQDKLEELYNGTKNESAEEKKERETIIKDHMKQFKALDLFKDRPASMGLKQFDVAGNMKGYMTNKFYADQYEEILRTREAPYPVVEINEEYPKLRASKTFEDGEYSFDAYVELSTYDIKMDCSCSFVYPMSQEEICGHILALIHDVWDKADVIQMPDTTDETGKMIFEAFREDPSKAVHIEMPKEKKTTKRKGLELSALVDFWLDDIKLSFDLGPCGKPAYGITDLKNFLKAYRTEGTYSYGNRDVANFATTDLTTSSMRWLDVIYMLEKEFNDFNNEMGLTNDANNQQVAFPSEFHLQGKRIDWLYELIGDQCLVTYDNTGYSKRLVTFYQGNEKPVARIRAYPENDAKGQVSGIDVSVHLPIIYKGEKHAYTIGIRGSEREEGYFSIVSQEDFDELQPFYAVANYRNEVSFKVGYGYLSEFYRRLIPKLEKKGLVKYESYYDDKIKTCLPPEASFRFKLDYEDWELMAEGLALYDDKEVNVLDTSQAFPRDFFEEARVSQLLEGIFNKIDKTNGIFRKLVTNDELFAFLSQALPVLEDNGVVLGSDAFNKLKIRRMPGIQMQVSLKSGLLELSLSSLDVDEEELLALLRSYKKKKKYHILSSGEFVDFSEHDQIDDTMDILDDLLLDAEDAIHHHASLPMFRALYLNNRLKEREDLVVQRDRAFRTLIQNFEEIKDAEYEIPAPQKKTLRQYQVYGYQWLRTLKESGFNGILADEMGLGKTLQMITLFQSAKDEGDQLPSLVVCPASLVYNWGEELKKFAPDVTYTLILGNADGRKGIIHSANMKNHTDVYVTSYDLLRRDVTEYKDIAFDSIALDEAQYIKNQSAAITKSVKTLNARHRYAMTGTPIENRLSELWSIFDFLMPGFLYGHQEFIDRFEAPILKSDDKDATQRLKNMVSPFILKRKKEDVLKDLPEKLEEVRYAKFEEEQQKIYEAQEVKIKGLVEEMKEDGQDKLKVLAELTRIREICCDPSLLFEDYTGGSAKRDMCLELISNAIDGGHRILVFSQFTSMLALLEEDLKKNEIAYFKLTGSTSKEDRMKMVHAFNDEKKCDVFLISLKAGGTGLNLTGADMVIHYDPWWNMAAQNQATDRAHRIGQTRRVTVIRMIVKDTIEEKILHLQEMKKDLADAILEGQSQSLMQMSKEELLDLLG